MGAELVKSGDLIAFESFDPNGFFDGVIDAQTARVAVARIKTLEEMLKAADQFGEYAKKFCLLEAQMYFKIAEIEGSEEKLTATQRDTVNYIRGLSEEEKSELLAEISDGIRIRTIINRTRREHLDIIKRNSADKEYERISKQIVNELKSKGHTSLTQSEYIRRWSALGEPNVNTIKAYTEKTRDKLLHSGGRGLGDSSGTYMLVKTCSRKDIAQIVGNRVKSILDDLKTLKQICDESNFLLPKQGARMIAETALMMATSDNVIPMDLKDVLGNEE